MSWTNFFGIFQIFPTFLYLKYFNFKNLGPVAPNPAVGELFFPGGYELIILDNFLKVSRIF